MSKLVDSSFRRYQSSQGWAPAVNICESCDDFSVTVDLAGVRPEEIDVELTGRVVTITGHRPLPVGCRQRERLQVHTMEIDHGRFSRSVTLPGDVQDTLEAAYRSGFLIISIPKKA